MLSAPRFAAPRLLLLTGLVILSSSAPLHAQMASNPLAVNFGSQAVGTPHAQTTVTFTVTAPGTMGTPLALTTGVANLDFTLGTGSTCTGSVTIGTCTVNIIFSPLYTGRRFGAVELTDASNAVIATALIYGIGTGPQVSFSPGTLSTVAGSGTPCADPMTPCGDGAPATDSGTNLNSPFGVALDGAGNLYIADSLDNRIRMVTAATGIISTVAGSGTPCYSPASPCGDGGLATAPGANFGNPPEVIVDGAGNLYIADFDDNRIRMVMAATGVLSTVVGSGMPCSSPTATCGDGGQAMDPGADLNHPTGLAIDGAGNLYIADYDDNRIRKVTAATGILSAVAGSGAVCTTATDPCGDGGSATSPSAAFYGPVKIALDGAGNLYISDAGDSRVRMVSATTGFLSTVAGSGNPCSSTTANCGDGGQAMDSGADLTIPSGMAVDAAGNLYISDTADNRIRFVSATTGIISTMAGTGNPCSNTTASCGDGEAATSPDAALYHPGFMMLDGAGNLYFADYWDNRIRKVSATAAPLIFVSTTVGQTSTNSAQTVTLNNIGNTALTFAPPLIGNNPTPSQGFTVGNSSTCPQLTQNSNPGTLASGASCTDLISFQPVNAGAINGLLTTTDNRLNAANSTQTVMLIGTATQGTKTIIFPQPPSQAAGTSYTLTATSSTGDPVTYTITSGPATLLGSVITYTGAGTVVIAADSATTANATAAPTVSDTVTVSAAPASILFTSAPPAQVLTGANAGAVLVALTGTGGATNTSVAATTVTLSVNGTNYTANTINGVATFNFATLNSAGPVVLPNGTYTYTASAPNYTLDTVSATSSVGLNSVWMLNTSSTLVQSSTAGAWINTLTNTNSSAANYGGIAFDSTGDLYSVNSTSNSLFFSTNSGGSTASNTGGGLNAPAALAIDGAGRVWIANSGNNSLAVFNSARTALSPSTGFGNADNLSAPSSVAIDNAGQVWIANKSSNSVTHLFGGAAPVVTPLATATANGALGTQP